MQCKSLHFGHALVAHGQLSYTQQRMWQSAFTYLKTYGHMIYFEIYFLIHLIARIINLIFNMEGKMVSRKVYNRIKC